jgi:hypothetical protein
LIDYRSFLKVQIFKIQLEIVFHSLRIRFIKIKKIFSKYWFYIHEVKTILNTISTITNDFNFSSSLQTGGDNFNFNFSVVNYLRKLKLASKIETIQN